MPSGLLRLTRLIGFLALLCYPISGLYADNSVVFGPEMLQVGSWVSTHPHRFACDANGEGTLVVSRPAADKRLWGGVVWSTRVFLCMSFWRAASRSSKQA
jgi:hypothetical protein